MKLKIEKHPQDVILNNYFRRIEALAENMGIDIDDLLQDSEIGSKSMQRHIKKEKLAIPIKRSCILTKFFNENANNDDDDSSIRLEVHYKKPI